MNKHHAHHYWRTTRHFRWQYLVLAAGVAAVVCLLALRSNSQQMAIRRNAVFAADRDNGDVQKALKELQLYVTSHMNTDLTTGDTNVYPPIQLQHTYERLVQQQSAQQQAGNDDLYTRAQNYCQAQNSTDFSGRNRVPCIEQYVAENGKQTAVKQAIPDSLYKFNFTSPRWSPDLAGWSLLASIVFVLLAVLQFVGSRIFRKHR